MRCSRKSLNETSKQQGTIFLSHDIAYFCPPFFLPLPLPRRVEASACGSIAFIKARCHGIVTAVRLISVLATRRCQPHRSRTLAARDACPPFLTRQNDTGAFLFSGTSRAVSQPRRGQYMDDLSFQPDKSDSTRGFVF